MHKALQYHSPLEGESARGRSPQSSRWGANAASRRAGGGQTRRPVSDYQRRVSSVVLGTLCVPEGSFQSAAYAATSARRPCAAAWAAGVSPHRISLRLRGRRLAPLRISLRLPGSASATPPQGGSDLEACIWRSSITPPLRGSRREGEARSRAGGGQTRRPVSDFVALRSPSCPFVDIFCLSWILVETLR